MPTKGTAKSKNTRSQRSKKVLEALNEESKNELENPFNIKLEKVEEEPLKIIIKPSANKSTAKKGNDQKKLSFGSQTKDRKERPLEVTMDQI